MLTTESSRVQFNGPTGASTFAIPFPFLETSHVKVIKTSAAGIDSTLSEGTHYSLLNQGNGGSLTLVTALGASELLTVYRELPLTQTADYANQDAFPAESHERSLDRLVMQIQQVMATASRAVRFTASSPEQPEISINAIPQTSWGYDGDGNFVLRDPAALREFLDLVGPTTGTNPVATWAVAGDRPAKVPDYIGQLGVERSTASIWIATGTSAGNWALFAIHDATLADDSALRPPTQGSVKSYVATREAALQAQIDALQSLIGENGFVEVPVGFVASWYSDSLPADATWIFCHGQTLSRAEYPDLFAHWGERFGAGDGVTTFVALDMRAMFARGNDEARGVDAGRVLGSYQADIIATHGHSSVPVPFGYATPGAPTSVRGVQTTLGTTGPNAGGGSETRPKNVSCHYIVKAKSIGAAVSGTNKWKPSVLAATTADLGATYANGAAGVGATLTKTSNGTLTVDGKAIVVGQRVLVKNQTTRAQNGIYVLTTLGSGSAPWVLTRAADMNTAANVAHAVCGCEEGSVNANDLFVCTTNTAAGTFVFGTSSIDFDAIYHATQGIVGKGFVTCATTANVTISSLTSGTTVDGVTLAAGDRVLVKDQTSPAENGLYDIGTSPAAPTRATNFCDWLEIPGSTITVVGGTMNTGSVWLTTVQNQTLPNTYALGTNPVYFVRIAGGDRINRKTGSYTLILSDAYQLVSIDSGSATTWTIPANSTVPFNIGTRIHGLRLGAGSVTIAAAGGVTIHSRAPGLAAGGQYARFEVEKIGTDEWVAFGDLT